MYFYLNFRGKRSDKKPNDELTIMIRYYYRESGDKKGKSLNISTGVKVKLKDWDEDWDKSKKREPIKRTDKEYKEKNQILKLQSLHSDKPQKKAASVIASKFEQAPVKCYQNFS